MRSGRSASARRYVPPMLGFALALLVAVGTGWSPYARLAPGAVDATLRPGQDAELAGVRYRLDSFVVAGTLPAQEKGDPPVQGPPGSVLVLVVVSQTVRDHRVALDEHFCDVTLTDGPGRSATVWQTDSDVTSLVARPAALGCGDSPSNPLRYDSARPMGFSFVVPADRAGQVLARLQVSGGGPALALRP